MPVRSDFKMYVEKDEFLNETQHSAPLLRKLTDVTAIVSLRDISRLSSRQEEENTPSVTVLSKREVEDLLRSIKDFNGREVFADATISAVRADHTQMFNAQTFVERDKLVGIYRLNKFFRPLGFTGISSAQSCTVSYTTPEGTYLAFYMPPIAEKVPKEKIRGPLKQVIDRAEAGEKISLPGFDGDIQLIYRNYYLDATKY